MRSSCSAISCRRLPKSCVIALISASSCSWRLLNMQRLPSKNRQYGRDATLATQGGPTRSRSPSGGAADRVMLAHLTGARSLGCSPNGNRVVHEVSDMAEEEKTETSTKAERSYLVRAERSLKDADRTLKKSADQSPEQRAMAQL